MTIVSPPTDNAGTRDELLVSLCRLAVGDSLRSVTHFTPRDTTVLYRDEPFSADGGESDWDFEEELLSTERLGFIRIIVGVHSFPSGNRFTWTARPNDVLRVATIIPISSIEGYNEQRDTSMANSALGEYKYTLRVFDNGFVSRIVVGNDGLLLTSDTVDVERLRELATAVQRFFEAAA